MNAKNFISDICKEIKYKPAQKYISEEIEGHIQDLKIEYSVKGYSENDAEEKAVEQMGDPIQIGKRLNKIHRPKLDWKLLILIITLIGFRVIASASSISSFEVKRNIVYMIIGIIFALVIYFLDYRKGKKWASFIFLIATCVLIFQVVDNYFDVTRKIFGNMYLLNLRLWNVSIPLYIIAFAGHMTDYKKEEFWDMVILYTISVIFIYFKSASITNTLILIFSYLTISATKILQDDRKNIKKVFALYVVTLSIALIVMFLMINISILYLFGGHITEENYIYNGFWYEISQEHEEKILNNLKLIGSTNEQEELYKINSSGFRFLYILGKLGIIPTSILTGIIIFTSVRIVKNSKNIKDTYGKYLVIGLGTTYIVQSAIHILMNLNLWIRSDVNLPFVAEGNLYFLINVFTFAIILSVYRRKDINFEKYKSSKILKIYRKFRKFENRIWKHITKRNILKDA